MADTPLPSYTWSMLAPGFWPVWLALGLMRLIVLLPFKLAMALGSGMGWLFFKLASSRRNIAKINLGLCYPALCPAEQEALLQKHAHDTGRGMMESLFALWARKLPSNIALTWENRDLLDQALARGQGVILLGLHMNCMDMVGRLINPCYRLDYMYQTHRNALLDTALTRARRQHYGEAIDRKNIRHLLRRLRQNKIIWYAPDQDHGVDHGVFSCFFGIQAATVTAISRLARLNNSAVILISYVRHETTPGYQVRLTSPCNFPCGEDVQDAHILNQFYEQAISYSPSQYMWLHRKFKTRPPGVSERYRRQDGSRYGD
ncbi:MAG: lipid A biosynthesis lauroyl acyltransferase [Pseudomonadales bacterium]|nr:lipid A biosynthesis lauroyl acyltransferase [Pseudomonadales bacterium]